jgi:hypothetical protein
MIAPSQALHVVMDLLANRHRATAMLLYRAPNARGWSASVLLAPISSGQVLPVGVSALADEVRGLLATFYATTSSRRWSKSP